MCQMRRRLIFGVKVPSPTGLGKFSLDARLDRSSEGGRRSSKSAFHDTYKVVSTCSREASFCFGTEVLLSGFHTCGDQSMIVVNNMFIATSYKLLAGVDHA